jgi:type VI protein secretion system component Hcp
MALDTFLVILPPTGGITIPSTASDAWFTPLTGATVLPLTAFAVATNCSVAPGSRQGAGATAFSAVSMTRPIDDASPALFQVSTQHQVLGAVQVYLRQGDAGAGNEPFLAYELQNAAIAELTWSADDADGATETISLVFEAMVIAARMQSSDTAALRAGWDQVQNQTVDTDRLRMP